MTCQFHVSQEREALECVSFDCVIHRQGARCCISHVMIVFEMRGFIEYPVEYMIDAATTSV